MAKSVLFYAPMRGELDIWPLLLEALNEGKVVVLPRFDERDRSYGACQITDVGTQIRPGHFGIREPVTECEQISTNRLDLILVPGVVFDPHGRRLGRGKGYYDQILSTVHGTRCGVGFDEQLVREVPVEPHDVLLNCILTPTRWLDVWPGSVLE